MKKIFLLALIALISIGIAIPAFAGYDLVNVKVKNVQIRQIQKGDNAGNDYVRVIGEHQMKVKGVAFQEESAFMFWGGMVDAGKALQPGQEVKLMTQSREFNGRTSYNVKEVVKD